MKGVPTSKAFPTPDGFVFHIVLGNVALCGVSGKFYCSDGLSGRECSLCRTRVGELRSIALRERIGIAKEGLSPDYLTVLQDSRWGLCGGRYFHYDGELVETDAHLHFVVNGVALCNSDFTQKSHRLFPTLHRCLTCLRYLGFAENIFPLRKRDFKRRFPNEWKQYLRFQRTLE